MARHPRPAARGRGGNQPRSWDNGGQNTRNQALRLAVPIRCQHNWNLGPPAAGWTPWRRTLPLSAEDRSPPRLGFPDTDADNRQVSRCPAVKHLRAVDLEVELAGVIRSAEEVEHQALDLALRPVLRGIERLLGLRIGCAGAVVTGYWGPCFHFRLISHIIISTTRAETRYNHARWPTALMGGPSL